MYDIAIICVLYNPNQQCISKWLRYTRSLVFNYIFIDNSSHSIKDERTQLPNYLGLGKNYGVAAAQNMGINIAKKLGVKYIIFFDQDSIIPKNLIESLKQQYSLLKDNGIKIGAIGPSLIEINTGHKYKGTEVLDTSMKEVNSLISSGTFTECNVLDDVGYLNSKLFIDLVDTEWCWRAVAKGYKLFMSSNILPHQVGKKTKFFLGFPIIISSPIRYYYQFRNSIWMIKCNYVPIKWKYKTIIRKIIECLYLPFNSNSFTNSIKYISKGIIIGIFKKL